MQFCICIFCIQRQGIGMRIETGWRNMRFLTAGAEFGILLMTKKEQCREDGRRKMRTARILAILLLSAVLLPKNAAFAAEVPEAIRKGKEDAMKKLITVSLDENESVTHDLIGKFGSASVLLKKAPEGTGVIAGGPARAVIELAGIKNIRTKSLGSNNKQNVVLATINGLSQIKTPEEVAKLRGKSVEEIVAKDAQRKAKEAEALAKRKAADAELMAELEAEAAEEASSSNKRVSGPRPISASGSEYKVKVVKTQPKQTTSTNPKNQSGKKKNSKGKK